MAQSSQCEDAAAFYTAAVSSGSFEGCDTGSTPNELQSEVEAAFAAKTQTKVCHGLIKSAQIISKALSSYQTNHAHHMMSAKKNPAFPLTNFYQTL
eukprot:CAMPEP_0113971034 /NCGR_PEP_ID=MMETSP0011_2-20120614/11853_1 /TAXON_ID=101924 /ORGANISM="Rhodosorus marinus" /LENGTH=95 /DNA_ID=CAMNT_0000986167 /DNA_START=515 /DNA_END=803 /DNA_ORIENTATION=+ /assembly_acc=CAM_ASM_000156